jgi:hypothetical protein
MSTGWLERLQNMAANPNFCNWGPYDIPLHRHTEGILLTDRQTNRHTNIIFIFESGQKLDTCLVGTLVAIEDLGLLTETKQHVHSSHRDEFHN